MSSVELIPSILVQSEQEFRDKLAVCREAGLTVQIDVADGVFVPNVTWADPGVVADAMEDMPFEAHLMVAHPEMAISSWIEAGATRIFVHAEAEGNVPGALEAIRDSGVAAGLAINPDTTVESVRELVALADAVLVMGVEPGFNGSPFDPVAIQKVAELKQRNPAWRVEVDGGVSLATAPALVAAGADALVVGSALNQAPDFGKAVGEFQKIFRR